ncbi:MAG: hypothetical protein AAB483_03140 [Patescibacteria group bacterium]
MYAFLSVYNKAGIEDFARELIGLGWKIIASGGTAKYLKDAGVEVIELATLIGAGEMLHHKVVTLDRKFHAMLLADGSPEETEELVKLGVPRIDLLCGDFYPQAEIKQTDIGGPTMVRAAAKGKRIVICDASDRARVIAWLKAGMPDEARFKQELCAKAEYSVAQYVLESARNLGNFTKCLYGENRWQTDAGLYTIPNDDPLAHDKFKMLEGTDRSYINFTDIDRLLQSATHIAAGFKKNFDAIPKIAIGAKHGNLCGAGVGEDALKKMLSGDPQAISGGWVLVNFALEKEHAELLKTYKTEKRILDGVIAPAISEEAIEVLARKNGKCRIVVNSALGTDALATLDDHMRFRYVRGGFLTQSNYTFVLEVKDKDLLLAWAVGSTSNSNTVTLIKDGMMIANATGQQSRVLACRLALMIAEASGHDTKGAAAYSDSFFPFIDGPQVLADAGIASLFVTSGSIRDDEVFAFLKSRNITVVSLPDEQARGFFGH